MKMLPQLLASAALLWTAVAQSPEPFPALNGYSSEGNPPQPFSPDPLVRYTWSPATNQSQLQIYRVERPISYKATTPSAITDGAQELLTYNSTDSLNIEIRGPTCLMIDWGVEYAGWLEFESPDLQHHSNAVSAAISEFNSPIPGKQKPLTKYKNTYRLETNKELYEGVRFTWIYFTGQEPWHITRLTLVAKVKPVNYMGAFAAFDSTLTQSWYTGAYAVRLNMESDAFNSILVERGDRVAIQGDGHPTMAAALVAFAPYSLVKDMLVQTNSGDVHGHNVVDQNIMAYPLYWTMSVNDWFMASGDVAGFKSLAQDCMSIVQKRVDDFLKNPDIVWMGWDDRIGNGWCFQNSCNREAHLTFAGLVVQACRDLARSLCLAGMVDDSRHFAETALRLFERLRQVPEWPDGFGVNAAANAINTGLVNPVEARRLFESALNDSVNICSWSPFNQYWILQALGNASKMDHAVASIKLCWGAMLTLGKGCFWEVFSPEWAVFLKDGDKAPTMPSYCHPWSSGVTAWLSHVLGGIQPLLPGYKEFVVAPHVSVRNPSVSTTVPTPFGPISVNATLGDRTSKHDAKVFIFVKAVVRGFVGIPKDLAASLACTIDNHRSLMNGKPSILRNATEILSVVHGNYAALAEHFAPARAAALLFVRIASPGTHIVEVRYSGDCKSGRAHATTKPTRAGIPHYRPFPVPRYAATTSLDRTSHGDGIFKYGTDGYVLFGFDNGTDLVRLPDYIQNVTVHNHGFDGWTESPRTFIGSSRSDESFLPDPRRFHNDTRALGMVTEDLNNRGSEGIIIDVQVSERLGSKRSTSLYLDVEKANMTEVGLFSLSIYCVSHDPNSKHAIRVMDLETFNVVAPDGFVSDYENGVWWTMRHKKSVRLRVMSIYGVQVSAIAFAGEKDRSIPGAIS